MIARIDELLSELYEVMASEPVTKNARRLEELLPGIESGSVSDIEKSSLISKLSWLNAAYFGRGDVARGVLVKGLLRKDFPKDFSEAFRELWETNEDNREIRPKVSSENDTDMKERQG